MRFLIFAIFIPSVSVLAVDEQRDRRSLRFVGERKLQSGSPSLTEIAIVGGVTMTSAKIGFRTDVAGARVRVEYGPDSVFSSQVQVTPTDFITSGLHDNTGTIKIDNLIPKTKYFYRVVVNEKVQDPGMHQSFSTFPGANETVKFSVFTDTARAVERNAPSYRSGGGERGMDDPLFAMQIGDFDHSNPQSLAELYAMHRRLRDPANGHGGDLAKGILSKMSFDHVWDDHDYCGQDTDKNCASKQLALQAYDEYYPTYDRPNPSLGIWHSFSAGAADIFMLDTRYQRDPDKDADGPGHSMLGAVQKQWLKDGLLKSQAKWKIIISTVTANKAARPSSIDHWIASFQSEAIEMADFIKDNEISNTVMISGDLHTGGGIDKGKNILWGIPEMTVSHTNLRNGNGGYDRMGDWSQGVTSGFGIEGGYSTVAISPDTLTLECKNSDGEVLHALTLPDTIVDKTVVATKVVRTVETSEKNITTRTRRRKRTRNRTITRQNRRKRRKAGS